jgi:hypothetical protein
VPSFSTSATPTLLNGGDHDVRSDSHDHHRRQRHRHHLAHPSAADAFDRIGLGDWFMYVVGSLVVAGIVAWARRRNTARLVGLVRSRIQAR